MPEISAELADYALKKLRARGIEVLLNTRVSSAGSTWVELTNRPRIATKTLIWTAGVTPHPLLTTLPFARGPQNRLVVNEYLELPDHPGIWALGDSAQVPNRRTGEFCPPTAQHAIRQGKLVAENIAATIDSGSRKAFAYRPLGMLSSLGRRSAVAQICGIKFSGFFAWWLWRTIYIETEVLYAGVAPGLVSGALQFNIRIPEGATEGGVVIQAGEAPSQAEVRVAIR